MAHLISKDGIARRDVPEAWLAANAKIMDYAVRVSGRHYVAVKCGPGLAAEAGTAQFVPALGEIHISTDVLAPGLKPAEVAMNDELFRSRFPLLVGGLLHELAHERYSRWVPRDLAKDAAEGRFKGRLSEVLVALEESRIEKRLISRYATAKQYLPAIVFDLLGREFKGGSDPYSASIALALILGRVEAGTIGVRDAKPFRDLIETHLSNEQIEAALGLVREYHDLPFHEWADLPLDAMESIARRWLDNLGDDPDAEQDGGTAVLVAHDHGSEGEGEGAGGAEGDGEGSEGSGEGEGTEGDLGAAVREAAASAKHDKAMDAADKAKRIRVSRDKAARVADAERREAAAEVASEVFQPGVGAAGDYGSAGRASRINWREPKGDERAAATILARKLAKAVFVEPFRAKAPMAKPGKRLRGRAAVQRKVQEQQGRIPNAKQWEGKVRHLTDEVPVKVGVVVDISGSMNALAEPLAVTGYVVGNAVEKAGGLYSQVVFGASATGVVRAGRKVNAVPHVLPADPWENIKDAVLAVDADLDLIDGEGARILIIASDGAFVNSSQQAWADTMFPLMAQKGVVLVHMDFENGWIMRNADTPYHPRHGNPFPPLEVPRGADPRTVANLLGDKIIETIKQQKAVRQYA
jgi:hypothetical protein